VCVTDPDGTAWSGYNCNISTPRLKTCSDVTGVTDCASCNAGAIANNVFCQWCTPFALSDNRSLTQGQCVSQTGCALNPNPSCIITVTYVPEPCPDDCSGELAGECRNVTGPAPGSNNPNATFHMVCVCLPTYSGINCGIHDDTVEIAVGLGAAAIVGIVIAIVVVLAAVGGGGYAIAQNMAAAPVAPAMNNPLYVGAGQGGENPLNRVG
jgi:hypothetical protein